MAPNRYINALEESCYQSIATGIPSAFYSFVFKYLRYLIFSVVIMTGCMYDVVN